jgi:hypothetical protein
MTTLSGTVTEIEFHPDGRFSASVQVEIPPNASHYELDTEQFGHGAHAKPLINPPAGTTAILITGPGHPVISWCHNEGQPNLKLDLWLSWRPRSC